MKQVVQNYRTGELKVDEVPVPVVSAGNILVKNSYSLISAGTEKSTVSVAKKSLAGKALEKPEMVKKVAKQMQKNGITETMRMVFDRLDTPAALGYSCAGEVIAVGSDVSEFVVGDRVACAGQNYASHAEIVSVPNNLCLKIPDNVSYADASYVAAGSIVIQGIRQADPKLGDYVAVIGLGLLGELLVQMLKANGCIVIATDLDESKLALATRLGADYAVSMGQFEDVCNSVTKSYGVDSVILTASTKSNGPVEMAGEVCRKKGCVVVVGAVGMNLPRTTYYAKELELKLSTSYGPGRYDESYEEKGNDYPYGYVRWTERRNMEAFLGLIEENKIQLNNISTHEFAIENAEDAYKLIMDSKEDYLGVLLKYQYSGDLNADRKIQVVADKVSGDINIGLIGVGNHVKDRLLPPLNNMNNVQLWSVCTKSGVKAKAISEKLGVKYCSSDYHEIISDDKVNAVLIGTRHDSHAQIVIDSIKANKHVFVEKPLCLTIDELDRIDALIEDKSGQLPIVMVGYNRRYSSHAMKAKEFFAGRQNPLVMSFRVNAGAIPPEHWIQDKEAGGGRMIGEGCHFIDYMQAISGEKPVSVVASCIGHHASGITQDHASVIIKFSNGSLGTLIYAAGGDSSMAKEYFEAFADGKSLVLDDFMKSTFYSRGKQTVYSTKKQDKGFAGEMEAYINEIASQNSVIPSIGDTMAVTRASIYAAMSMQTNQMYSL
jgi:predicted dehydrogenase/threonine dehydrogenase-like Zn-dependent dehydrogenase